MNRDFLDWITSKLLARCGMHQNNKYGNGDCLVFWDKSHANFPKTLWFVKKTKLGKWLEKRWVKRTHKRIGK